MAEEPKATPDHVPDVVLEELLAAFAAKDPDSVDLDDPAIDHLLGLAPAPTDPSSPTVPDPSDDLARPLTTSTKADSSDISVWKVATDSQPINPKGRVIVIGDDELPDAIYLDEESSSRLREIHGEEETGERSTIVIKDLDETGAIEALPARSSGSMDPRVRARRIAVRRAKGRKRLIWVAIAAAILLVLVGAIAVLASSLFDVRTIEVQGAVYTDKADLSAIVDHLRGEAILLVDTRQVERELEKIPWVESARVTTHFPHSVFIDIRERKAIATFAGSDGKYRVIDRDGRVLDVLDGEPIDYMLITGANPDVERGQFSGGPFEAAAQLAIALPAEIRSRTESIGLDTTTGNLSLSMQNKLVVQLGPSSDMQAKLVRLLAEVRSGLDGICSLDVSTTEIARTTCV